MKYLLAVLLLSVSLVCHSVEMDHLWTLNEGDDIWLSADGESWTKTQFIEYTVIPICGAVPQIGEETTQDIGICDAEINYRTMVWYKKPAEPVDPVSFITGRDPDRAPVSAQEEYGLLTRFENILINRRVNDAFFDDRQRLLEVLESTRERLKASP